VSSTSYTFISFFLTIRPPLNSTLLPYTTLFRSVLAVAQYFVMVLHYGNAHLLVVALVFGSFYFILRERDLAGALLMSLAITIKIDRKSTRLNSSHDQISYAVFCLKKKKTQ